MFNYFNLTSPDTSGQLRFLTDELQDAEDAGDRGTPFVPAPLFYVSVAYDLTLFILFSLDTGTRAEWMGRHKRFAEPYESLSADIRNLQCEIGDS